VSTHPEYILRLGSQRLADLKRKTAELERELWDARESLEQEVAHSAYGLDGAPGELQESLRWGREDDARLQDAMLGAAGMAGGGPGHGGGTAEGLGGTADDRTAALLSHGRPTAGGGHFGRRLALAAGGTAVVAVIVVVLVLVMSGPGAQWPHSVVAVQRQIATACQNPDVKSEPSQVNFACAKATRQVLWVFSLMTSGNDPNFASIKTGREGLEPITPAQGGEIAWSLNLHHPYDPANPIDSLQVAARAINNIIGGATLTGANGKPVVQPGLESAAANCVRYTGSARMLSRRGYPDVCAKPVVSAAGQAALVADVYQKWVVGAGPGAAQNAATLFENAKNPGDPRVRAILKSLPGSRSAA
jgi:hypothetical protein